YSRVSATAFLCVALRLSPLSASHSAVGAAASAALSTALCAIAATWSILGFTLRAASSAAPAIESTAEWALEDALFKVESRLFETLEPGVLPYEVDSI